MHAHAHVHVHVHVNVLGVVLKARPDTAPRKALKDEYTTPHQGRLGRARRANRCVDRAGRAPSRCIAKVSILGGAIVSILGVDRAGRAPSRGV